MLGVVASIMMLIGVTLSIRFLFQVKIFKIYRYLITIYILHFVIGVLWSIVTLSLVLSKELYRNLWPVIFLASVVLMLEVTVFTHGNIREVLRKVLPGTTAFVPLSFLAYLIIGSDPIYLTPGTSIAIATCGFIVALILELIYVTSKIYSIMRGGKLFYFWRRLLIMTIYYMVYGLVYSISGVLVMLKLISYGLGNALVATVYLGKTLMMHLVTDYYNKNLKPIIEKISI